MNNEIITSNAKAFFEKDEVKKKFQELLGKRATSFVTSVLQIVASNELLKKADPTSIYQAAAVAATLDLPLNNNLGFAYLKMKKYELAKVAILDALLVSPTRGIAWLNATEIFAELDNNQVATQALRVALHFATNKQKAIETLSDENKITSEKMRSIVKKNLVDAEQIPTFQRN
jgi:tetratricopeptide (TPR) repeat protein